MRLRQARSHRRSTTLVDRCSVGSQDQDGDRESPLLGVHFSV